MRPESHMLLLYLLSSSLSQLFMILATLATEIRNSFNMFFALQKFALRQLLTALFANVLMRLGCQGKGTEDFSGQ